ncbi:MAG TPA: hypothetical protein VLJ15_08905, partial [Gammaproteobacteria bacterium]|nr:hypothetical protein [Gammaproteobacteria bacterium]
MCNTLIFIIFIELFVVWALGLPRLLHNCSQLLRNLATNLSTENVDKLSATHPSPDANNASTPQQVRGKTLSHKGRGDLLNALKKHISQ